MANGNAQAPGLQPWEMSLIRKKRS